MGHDRGLQARSPVQPAERHPGDPIAGKHQRQKPVERASCQRIQKRQVARCKGQRGSKNTDPIRGARRVRGTTGQPPFVETFGPSLIARVSEEAPGVRLASY